MDGIGHLQQIDSFFKKERFPVKREIWIKKRFSKNLQNIKATLKNKKFR